MEQDNRQSPEGDVNHATGGETELTTDPVRNRGIYLLPNLLTTGAMFGGFYAILAAMSGNFEFAAIAIFAAGIFDGLDGRVARLTNTQSAFGVQYDSISDMVSFGIAPAVVVYAWALQDLGKPGWVAAFLYSACAALRLARFNVQVSSVAKGTFIGLASPAAAGLVAAMVWTWHDAELGTLPRILAWVVTSTAGLLMVSNLRYNSFKEFDVRGKVPFVAILAVVVGMAILQFNPPAVLLALGAVYTLSAPLMFAKRKLVRRSVTEHDDNIADRDDG